MLASEREITMLQPATKSDCIQKQTHSQTFTKSIKFSSAGDHVVQEHFLQVTLLPEWLKKWAYML